MNRDWNFPFWTLAASSAPTKVSNVAFSHVLSGIIPAPALIFLDVNNGFSKKN